MPFVTKPDLIELKKRIKEAKDQLEQQKSLTKSDEVTLALHEVKQVENILKKYKS
ncbi:MAG: hypothetical protein ACXAEU_08830 [Candidatus Hodarchaeales archaeon]|jgi:hypothetical protein